MATPKLISVLDPDLLEAQIELNAKAMEEINALKEERSKMVVVQEKMFKEGRFLMTKLEKAYEQLNYSKKKVNKGDDNDDGKENANPNEDGPSNSSQ